VEREVNIGPSLPIGYDWTSYRTSNGRGNWRSEVGSRKSEVGSRKSEVGSRKSEVGSRKSEVGSRKSEVGSRRSEVGKEAATSLPGVVLRSPGWGRSQCWVKGRSKRDGTAFAWAGLSHLIGWRNEFRGPWGAYNVGAKGSPRGAERILIGPGFLTSLACGMNFA
jgi:hypothetical protein